MLLVYALVGTSRRWNSFFIPWVAFSCWSYIMQISCFFFVFFFGVFYPMSCKCMRDWGHWLIQWISGDLNNLNIIACNDYKKPHTVNNRNILCFLLYILNRYRYNFQVCFFQLKIKKIKYPHFHILIRCYYTMPQTGFKNIATPFKLPFR